MRCDATAIVTESGSRCLWPGSSQADSANLEFSLTLLWGGEAVPNQSVAGALGADCGPLPAASSMIDPLGGDNVT